MLCNIMQAVLLYSIIVSASRHPPTPLEPKIVKCVVSWSPQLEVSTNKQTGDEGVRSKGEKGSGEKGVRR